MHCMEHVPQAMRTNAQAGRIGSSAMKHSGRNAFWRMLPIAATAFAISFLPASAKESVQHIGRSGKAPAISHANAADSAEAKINAQIADSAAAKQKTVLGMRNEYELLAAWFGLMAAFVGGACAVGRIRDRVKQRNAQKEEIEAYSETGMEEDVKSMMRQRGRSGI